MHTAEIFNIDGNQAVRLPDDFRFDASRVSIRREGKAIIIEPIRADKWPEGFFDAIHIEDPAFTRPPQGDMPAAHALD